MNKIITGVFMHNFSTPVNDKSEVNDLVWVQMHKNHIDHIEHLGFIGQNPFKCFIKSKHHTRTPVSVPSTCTNQENQVLFEEK